MNADVKHPIVLEQLFFTRSSVIAIPEHLPAGTPLVDQPENILNVSKIDGSVGRYSASLRTLVNQAQSKLSPYVIDMECVAFFAADDTLNEDEAIRGVTITANSVLYGAIRESVAWLTARQPYGPILFGLSVLKSAPTLPES